MQDTIIKGGEYNGKFEISNMQDIVNALILGGGSGYNDNVLYMDNCNIIGKTKAINLSADGPATGNKCYVSNSKITGTVNVDSGNELMLGTGMEISISDVTGNGTKLESNVSFRGMDKILMGE